MLAVPSLFNASLYRFKVSTEFMNVGRRVGSRIVPSARNEILGFCEFPRLEVIRMTPFAPSAPYTAVAAASFSKVKDSISSASISCICRGTPSTNTSGFVPPLKELCPRIQKSALSYPGSPERCTAISPGTCPAKLLVILRLEETDSSLGPIALIELTTLFFFCLP